MRVPITPQARITLHLALALEDGTVVESTFDDEPITFTMGDGSLAHGLELALYGLYTGDRQRLELPPVEAFGMPEPGRVHRLPRADFGAGIELQPGAIVGFETAAGEELPGTVVEVTDEEVTVDFNHPLAGRTLIYDVEIIEVVPAAGGD